MSTVTGKIKYVRAFLRKNGLFSKKRMDQVKSKMLQVDSAQFFINNYNKKKQKVEKQKVSRDKMRAMVSKDTINNAVKLGIEAQIEIGKLSTYNNYGEIIRHLEKSFPKVNIDLFAIGVVMYFLQSQYTFKDRMKDAGFGEMSEILFTYDILAELKKIPEVNAIASEFKL